MAFCFTLFLKLNIFFASLNFIAIMRFNLKSFLEAWHKSPNKKAQETYGFILGFFIWDR